jgi:3-dehydroquinate synthase class II
MVIAEALTKIKDLEKERASIQANINNKVFIMEDEKATPVEAIIADYEAIAKEIAKLKTQVIATNISTKISIAGLDDVVLELNLMEALKEIEHSRHMEQIYRGLAGQVDNRNNRFMSIGYGDATPIKLINNFNKSMEECTSIANTCRDRARAIEKFLVKANWQTDLV